MENWEVVGVDTKAEITIKAEGKLIRGVKLFLIGDAPEDRGERYLGKIAREQFLSNERLGALGVAPKPGDLITIYFNRYGDVAKIEVLSA